MINVMILVLESEVDRWLRFHLTKSRASVRTWRDLPCNTKQWQIFHASLNNKTLNQNKSRETTSKEVNNGISGLGEVP